MKKTYQEIVIDLIDPDPAQPRKWFDEDELAALADSIRQDGVLQPIEVSEQDGRYLLHHGERRLRASKLAGKDSIPAVVAPRQTEPLEALLRGMIENLLRADLAPIDEARAYARLRDGGMVLQEIAQRVGRSAAHIGNRLQWLVVEQDEILTLVNQGKLPVDKSLAHALLRVPDAAARVKLAQQMAESSATLKTCVAACDHLAKRFEKQRIAGLQAATVRTPSLALSVNGHGPKAGERVPLPVLRKAAKASCAQCYYVETAGMEEPAWSLVTESAGGICRDCPVRLHGDGLEVCKECPMVALLRALVGAMLERAQ